MQETSNRHQVWQNYIEQNLGTHDIEYLPPDCSNKQFGRIIQKEKRSIIMDTSQDTGTYDSFLKINQLLREKNLRAPEIYFSDPEKKLMIIEDFGHSSFTTYLSENIEEESNLYNLAVKGLAEIQKIDYALKSFDSHYPILRDGIKLFEEWFIKKWCKVESMPVAVYEQSDRLFQNLEKQNKVLVLRDYHADNLYYFKEQQGLQRLGIIDFQDAVIGHTAYDLVSLLEDARRDVSVNTVKQAYEDFCTFSEIMDIEELKKAYQILGMQRNLRIIGVFIRKMLRDNQIRYKKYIPRVYSYLVNNPLMHEREFYPLLKFINDQMPSILTYGE